MRSSGKCPKCASQHLIKDVRIFGRGQDGSKNDLSTEIYERPDALVFKRTHQGTLQAWICGDCGLTELYVSNPDEIWAIFSDKD